MTCPKWTNVLVVMEMTLMVDSFVVIVIINTPFPGYNKNVMVCNLFMFT